MSAIAFGLLGLSGSSALAQLSVERACATLNRPMLVRVDAPADDRQASFVGPDAPPLPGRVRVVTSQSEPPAALRLDLLAPDGPEPIASVPIKPGVVDLGLVFPKLWSEPGMGVRFVQLRQGERGIGPAIELVPMVQPEYAPRVDRAGTPAFASPTNRARTFSGYWLRSEQQARVRTTAGDLVFRLRTDAAPRSVAHFSDLASKGFYDATPIHRVASLRGRPEPDLVQFGDPTGTGFGGPGFMIDLEKSPLLFTFGTLGFARTSDPNSAGSQLVLTLSRAGGMSLDGQYTAFAELVDGDKTLAKLAKTPVDADAKPTVDLRVLAIELEPAPPRGEGPEPAKEPTSATGER